MKRKSRDQKQRPKTNPLTVLLILILLVAAGWGLYRLQGQLTRAQAEIGSLSAQVEALQKENEALAQDIAEGSTTEKMEKIARDELDWTLSDEYVFYDKRS